MIGIKHTVESVAAELVAGLRNGTIVLTDTASPTLVWSGKEASSEEELVATVIIKNVTIQIPVRQLGTSAGNLLIRDAIATAVAPTPPDVPAAIE